MGYQFSLPMVIRWRPSHAEAPLTCSRPRTMREPEIKFASTEFVSSWRHLQVYLLLWVKDTLGDVWHAGKLICSFILRLTLAQKGSLSLAVVSLLVMRAKVDMITAYVVHCR